MSVHRLIFLKLSLSCPYNVVTIRLSRHNTGLVYDHYVTGAVCSHVIVWGRPYCCVVLNPSRPARATKSRSTVILFGPRRANSKNGFVLSAILIIHECRLLFMQIPKRVLRYLRVYVYRANWRNVSDAIGLRSCGAFHVYHCMGERIEFCEVVRLNFS